MRNFYIEQSSGRYTVNGDVTDWVRSRQPSGILRRQPRTRNVWLFLKDSVDGWYQSQIAAGKTPDQIDAYLSQFDVWDRYDYDGDGNFDEPDGYIDTFQSVHAGEGEEAGAAPGHWAIWSHSWYAFSNLIGIAGPDFNKFGGVQIGDSNYWVGKYTIQPENGGVGVFTHEFGHDLGLPDLYDTAGGENGTGFWTLMSSGSWMDDGTMDIGSKSSHMGAWEKFQLGWLNYEVAHAGQKSEHKLGPDGVQHQAGPGPVRGPAKKSRDEHRRAVCRLATTTTAARAITWTTSCTSRSTWPAGSTLTAKVKYNIELDWDYAYLVVSTDGGATWTSVQTNLSTTTDPNGQNFGYGITGISSGWVDLTANLAGGQRAARLPLLDGHQHRRVRLHGR